MRPDTLVPNAVKDIKVNARNMLSLDVANTAAFETLHVFFDLDGVQVHFHIPLSKKITYGVICDIDETISYSDLPILIQPATDGAVIAEVSRTVKPR